MPIAPCSWGDLIDRITILSIKAYHVQGAALENVKRELDLLNVVVKAEGSKGWPEGALLAAQTLRSVNESLWDCENRIRKLADGQEYIETSRLIHTQNDKRAALKRKINELMGSSIMEEKLHV